MTAWTNSNYNDVLNNHHFSAGATLEFNSDSVIIIVLKYSSIFRNI